MRLANFVEGLFFMVGFLVVCLVVLTSRPLQPLPARKTVPVIPVVECAPLTQFISRSDGNPITDERLSIAASTSPRSRNRRLRA